MRPAVAYALALALDLVGGAGALLASTRTWQTVRTPRPAPRPFDVLALTGRTVDAAPTALGLVALAGVVAVLATRGSARRLIGALLVVDAMVLGWRAVTATSAVGTGRARALVAAQHRSVDVSSVVPHVTTHVAWAVLTVVCAVLVLASGVLVAARGHTWRTLSARYERRPGSAEPVGAVPPGTPAGTARAASAEDAERDAARAAASLWTSLDRGDDPTTR